MQTQRASGRPAAVAFAFAVVTSLLLVPAAATAQEAEPTGGGGAAAGAAPGADRRSKAEQVLRSIKWETGPTSVTIGEKGEMKVPEGYVYTGPEGTRKMLELMENPTTGTELGLLTPKTMAWFVLFEFSSVGYIKDADKEKLDGEEILGSIRKGNEQGNERRRARGWPEIRIVGWQTPPFYDAETKHLKWCIKGESRGRPIVNFNTRMLGREGVMSANLMVSPAKLEATLPEIKGLLGGFAFKEGHRYAEYKPGDKIATYGLAALVVGGAAAAAAKVGLLAKFAGLLGKLWKLLIVGLLGIGAGIKALFSRRRREDDAPTADEAPPPPPPAA